MSGKLIAVAKTSSKGSSLRITIPMEIAEKLYVSESEHIGFYEVNGEIVIKKIE
jgi:bifunctional DNA-binding transcriptional regulator/antitoxin component of YhaV-PrlF toxin-antitoxin module